MRPVLFLLEVAASNTRLGTPAGPDLTRYFGVLIVLVLAIVGLALGFKKLFARTIQARAAQRHLAIVDLLPLGGKQRLAIVRCYDRTFALGLGDKEVSLVAEIDPVNVEGRESATPTRADRAGFAALLQRAFPQPPRPQRTERNARTDADTPTANSVAAAPPRASNVRSSAPIAPTNTVQAAPTHVGKRVADLLSTTERPEQSGRLDKEGLLA